ncbi:heme-binding domain-containing protein [Candidatus Binatia bacterium]|nr:heme-binding domain-containing protein [Candidatus Binatia bacterium]
MRRVLRIVIVALAGLLVLAQFVPVDRTNPPVEGDVAAPPEVESALRTACYDCHSNETTWPWYGHVAPVSWLLAYDVSAGREELNFSSWQNDDARRRQKKQKEIVETLGEGEMPPWYYLAMHPDARRADLQLIRRWAEASADSAQP